MKRYEIMYILNADLSEEERKAEIEKIHGIITNGGGQIHDVNEWGIRDFAYPINYLTKGYYVVIKISANKEILNEFERINKINPRVIRYLIVVDK
ncbi:MAG: 30S ribosomal protein S6 [Bacilli bacterium]|jgi:small subunit ribosomal protein S6